MFVYYTPEGQGTQKLEFKPGRVRYAEQAQIERLYARESGQKTSFLAFVGEVREGYAAAVRVLLFTLLRRQHPQIRFEDVNPTGDEVEIKYHKAELEELRAGYEQHLPPGIEKDAMISRVNQEIAEAEEGEEDEPGKATGSSSSTSTGTSPTPSRKRGRTMASRSS